MIPIDSHLGYGKHEARPEGQTNSRNGYRQKKVQGDSGVAEIAVPQDRQGEFEPHLMKKGQSRLSGLDEKIIALYARGMSVRDIQAQLQEMYGVEVSPTLISNITDAVIDEVKQWQNRPLDAVYPIVFLDCLVLKVRGNGRVINKSLYFALSVNMDGYKELLGMWISPNEGAKFWLSVLTEIHNRGVKDILIACVDGLTGFPNAIESMNSSLRKVIKSQQIFPTDESAFKFVYLAMRNISKKWTMPIRDWKPALNRFAILFEDRLYL